MLTVVIPSSTRPDLLERCLQCVCKHRHPTTEVIVVDDGSRDGRVSRVARQFAGVNVIRHERSLGFARAANRGIAAAAGGVIELLNDDTEVEPGWSATALHWFADPTVAAVAPLVLCGPPGRGEPAIDSAGDGYDPGGFAFKRGRGRRVTPEYRQPCEVFGASASSAFYRADVLRAVGGFPEDFGAYFEDVDLAWRIRRAGYRCMYEPGSVVWHRVGSSYRPRRTLLESQSRNEERVYWRNVPDVWRTLPWHAAVLAAKAVRRTREGTVVPWAMGRLRAFAEVPAMIRGRAAGCDLTWEAKKIASPTSRGA